ncbi:MAG: hypothetical protein AAGA48_24360 [Myxococcota bacterium]
MNGWWLLASAVAAAPPGWTRTGKPLREPRAALVSFQIDAFAGGLFREPLGEPVSTPSFPSDVDLEAVHDRARTALRNAARQVGLKVEEATPWGSIDWDDRIPGGNLQAAIAVERDAAGLIFLRLSLGWCPGSVASDEAITEANGVLCVRSHETALGGGPPAVEGYLVQRRIDAPGPSVRARKVSFVGRQYRYTRLAGSIYGDAPIVGEGPDHQSQAENAVTQAVVAFVRTASRVRRP